ncbi:gamma-soluble NSF attachment protein-like isoform X2 [Anthonomus grandis grandis]|uniref:gamma-soluble NSF attachment protein-like isoform X2 n=1 Tax=Anthonomus grandis grandis TaxID=2921223 RepID=UPI00216547B0|nr:gamma-soluble NSF attachment protein-like isoform X2 [Anthonomus grandis grandis]
MASNRKIEEGLEHVKNAEKSLKTGLLKWRPDYENAADEFNKAATCFRNAKSYQQCKDCLLKAADCHKQNRGLFYAAKALDQCISICKEMGDLRDIYSMAERAAHMFQSQGSPDSASSILEKAAKILESNVPMEALNLYKHAAEIAQIQDNQRQAAEFTSKVARLHVKLLQYDQAADAIRREIGIHQANESIQALGRLVVALVLVQLARGDIVAAEKAFKEWGTITSLRPKVLGLSKFTRIVEMYSRKLQGQERFIKQIVVAVLRTVQPNRVAVIFEGMHLCMTMRGVQKIIVTR